MIGEGTRSSSSRSGGAVRRVLTTTTWLVVWIYVYLIILLSGWVVLASAAGGWQPTVITSGSMQPTIRVGDVLMVADHPDELLGQGAVLVLDRGEGSTVAHRVFAVEDGKYVTKGDANAVPDSERVDRDAVVGVGHLVVPAIGMPIVWAEEGNLVPLIVWAITTLAAVAAVVTSAVRRIWRGETRSTRPTTITSRAGVHRLRILVAAMIALQYLVDRDQFVIDGLAVPSWAIPVFMTALLGLVNSITRSDGTANERRAGLLGLSVDTIVVVVLAASAAGSGVVWILFALPIIEAAISFGIAGALFHWLILTSITLVSRIWVSELSATGSSRLIGELEQVLDQLSILFLVVIPGAYLAEQLLVDVRSQEQATEAAKDRSSLLETVVEAGHEVNRLGGENVEALVDAAIELGFDTADVVAVDLDAESTVVAHRSTGDGRLPIPGSHASGVMSDDLQHETVIVDALDPSPAEIDALRECGLTAVVATLVRSVDSRRVVLRVGTSTAVAVSADRLDAVRLLASQAGVALTNDELVGELRGMRDEMTHQARHDSLTGLPNRAGLRPALTKALSDGSQSARPALLFLDLNGFKPVNDRLGHAAGDELLCALADRLTDLLDSPDFVARLGGDEFVVILHAAHRAKIDETVNAISELFDRAFELKAGKVHLSTAMGCAVADSDIDASELLRRADVAMYEAKRTRTSLVDYSRQLDEPHKRRNALAAEVEHAVYGEALELHYQPIVHAPSGRIVGVEALVRWEHPVHGAVPPPVLIDAAHDAGIGQLVNDWIMNTAIGKAREWGFGRDSNLFMTVNASAEELEFPWVASNVLDAIERHGVPTTAVWVELGEHLVRDPRPIAAANLAALRERGVQLLLDDFGEGQTSLGHLSRLPIGGVKLGREFVAECMNSEADRIVLESVTNLSTRLGFVVIAEGIETEEVFRNVLASGCQLVQGFHLHRPLTADRVAALIQSQDRLPVSRGEGAE